MRIFTINTQSYSQMDRVLDSGGTCFWPWRGEFSTFSHFYRPQRSCGKVMFSQASVILFTGVCVWQTPPWADTPPPGRQPLGRHLPADTPPPSRRLLQWTVRILLECILVQTSTTNVILRGGNFTSRGRNKYAQWNALFKRLIPNGHAPGAY